MDHGDCPVVSSKPSDPQQRRPDGATNVALQTRRELVFCCRGSPNYNATAVQQNEVFYCSFIAFNYCILRHVRERHDNILPGWPSVIFCSYI